MSTGFPKPLEGKVIIDFSLYLPGPYCTTLLTAFGARVIKLEPLTGDPVRKINPDFFEELNRDKESVSVDLKTEEGQATALALTSRADAILEGFRPGTMRKFGLSYEDLRPRNKKLVYCSISGFGQTGPYRTRAAHDMNCLAGAGYFSVPSELDNRPARPQLRIADLAAGQSAAHALSMALWEVERSGQGREIDVSMFDVMAHWSAQMILGTPDLENSSPVDMPWVMADSSLYKTSDGRYIALATLEDKYWNAFAETVENFAPSLRNDCYSTRRGRDENKVELSEALAELIGRFDLKEWQQMLDGVETCIAPVLERNELLSDPHFVERGLTGCAGASEGKKQYSLHPVIMDGERPTISNPAPRLGQRSAFDFLAS